MFANHWLSTQVYDFTPTITNCSRTKRKIFAGGINVCRVGSSGHLLMWVWRRVEKRGGCEELDLSCVFALTRCAVGLGSKTVV
jgi:hypothetical protein